MMQFHIVQMYYRNLGIVSLLFEWATYWCLIQKKHDNIFTLTVVFSRTGHSVRVMGRITLPLLGEFTYLSRVYRALSLDSGR